jgi:hypothetical protein
MLVLRQWGMFDLIKIIPFTPGEIFQNSAFRLRQYLVNISHPFLITKDLLCEVGNAHAFLTFFLLILSFFSRGNFAIQSM